MRNKEDCENKLNFLQFSFICQIFYDNGLEIQHLSGFKLEFVAQTRMRRRSAGILHSKCGRCGITNPFHPKWASDEDAFTRPESFSPTHRRYAVYIAVFSQNWPSHHEATSLSAPNYELQKFKDEKVSEIFRWSSSFRSV